MDMIGLGRAHSHSSSDTPVAVISRTFPVDTTLSDLWTFLRDSLGQTTLSGDELMGVDATVAEALTEVDDDTRSVTVSLRIFPHSIEIDVLLSDEPSTPSANAHITQGLRHISYEYKRNNL